MGWRYQVSSADAPAWFCSSNLVGVVVFSDVSQLLNTDRHAEGLIQAAKQLLGGEKSFKRRKILTDLLQNLEDRSELESREEDQDWFSGMTTFLSAHRNFS